LWDVQTIDFEQPNPANPAEAVISAIAQSPLHTRPFQSIWTTPRAKRTFPNGQMLASGSDDQRFGWNAHDGTC